MDRIIRASAADGYIKMAVISAPETVERARAIHSCAPTAAAALGRTLCAASLLGNALKEKDGTVTIRINGGGPLGSIIAVSDSSGNVRGLVEAPETDPPRRSDGKLNVGAAVGTDGLITVTRDIGLREPYIGSTELMSGEIAEDVTRYLTESEQVPSACGLGVLVEPDGSVSAAGGFIVQLMPGADPKYIDILEDNIFYMDQLTTILKEDGPYEIFKQVLKGVEYHLLEESCVEYKCYCSRDRVREAISCIDDSELDELINADEEIEVGCQFCDKKYIFSPADLLQIKTDKQKEET